MDVLKPSEYDLEYLLTTIEIREAIAKYFGIPSFLWDIDEYKYLTDIASRKARRETIKQLLIEVPMTYSLQGEIKSWLERKEKRDTDAKTIQ